MEMRCSIVYFGMPNALFSTMLHRPQKFQQKIKIRTNIVFPPLSLELHSHREKQAVHQRLL